MAAKTKTGLGEAVASLKTAEALESLPSTPRPSGGATCRSPRPARSRRPPSVHPEGGGALLKAAAEHGFRGLRDRCAQVRAASSSARQESERYRAIHASRYFRHYSESDGAFRLDARLTPDAGAKLVSAIEAEAKAVFEQARKSGNRESSAAYAADALVALVTGASGTFGTRQREAGRARCRGAHPCGQSALRRARTTR